MNMTRNAFIILLLSFTCGAAVSFIFSRYWLEEKDHAKSYDNSLAKLAAELYVVDAIDAKKFDQAKDVVLGHIQGDLKIVIDNHAIDVKTDRKRFICSLIAKARNQLVSRPDTANDVREFLISTCTDVNQQENWALLPDWKK